MVFPKVTSSKKVFGFIHRYMTNGLLFYVSKFSHPYNNEKTKTKLFCLLTSMHVLKVVGTHISENSFYICFLIHLRKLANILMF